MWAWPSFSCTSVKFTCTCVIPAERKSLKPASSMMLQRADVTRRVAMAEQTEARGPHPHTMMDRPVYERAAGGPCRYRESGFGGEAFTYPQLGSPVAAHGSGPLLALLAELITPGCSCCWARASSPAPAALSVPPPSVCLSVSRSTCLREQQESREREARLL